MKTKYVQSTDGGIVKNLPKNVIPDNAWTDGWNVRFGNGYMEKVEGWRKFNDLQLDGPVKWMDNFYKTDNSAFLLFHTCKKVYKYNDNAHTVTDISDVDYSMTIDNHWNTENVQDMYVMTNLVDNVRMWNGLTNKVEKMPGLWEPPNWIPGHEYKDGDYVQPMKVNANGYIYRANVPDELESATSGETEPVWPTENGGHIQDGMIRWTLAGTVGVEGLGGTIAATDVKAKCMLNYSNFLILGHTVEDSTNYPQRIRWSQYGDCTKWHNNEDGSGQAGYWDLTEGVDWVQAIKPMGPHIVVYKERSIQVLTYVGGDLIFEKRPAIIGTGLLAPHAIVDLGNEHIFVGPDNIYSFDLIEPKIAGDDMAKEFFRLLLPQKSHLTTAFFIEEIPEIWFTFYSINNQAAINGEECNPDMALVYNTDTKKWSIRDMPMTAFGFYILQNDVTIDDLDMPIDDMNSPIDTSSKLSNAPINLGGDKDGNIYWFTEQDRCGEDYSAWIISKMHDMDNPTILKRLMRVQIMTSKEGPYNLKFWVGTANNVAEPGQWYGPYYMNMETLAPPWVDMDLTARHFMVKFGTDEKNQPFKVTGYVLYYEERGEI